MKDTISLTIPLEHSALTRASDMLHGLAIDISKGEESFEDQAEREAKITREAEAAASATESSAAEVFEPVVKYLIDGVQFTHAELLGANYTIEQIAALPVVGAAPENAEEEEIPPPAGVDLDSDGIPWDPRIHGANKNKLAKTQQWKKKRGVDAALVATVEAELRAAMAAGPENPVVTGAGSAGGTAPPPATTDPAPPPPPPATTDLATITSFPEFMAAVTRAGLTPETVLAALNKQGLPSVPLLAARPDLIPAIAADLFGA